MSTQFFVHNKYILTVAKCIQQSNSLSSWRFKLQVNKSTYNNRKLTDPTKLTHSTTTYLHVSTNLSFIPLWSPMTSEHFFFELEGGWCSLSFVFLNHSSFIMCRTYRQTGNSSYCQTFMWALKGTRLWLFCIEWIIYSSICKVVLLVSNPQVNRATTRNTANLCATLQDCI